MLQFTNIKPFSIKEAMHIYFRSALLIASLMITIESTCGTTEFISSLSNRPAVQKAGTVLSTVVDFGLLSFGSFCSYMLLVERAKEDKGISAAFITLSLGLLYLKRSYALERTIKTLLISTDNKTEQITE